MYKIVWRAFNNCLTVTEYGFSHYILKRYLFLSEQEEISSIDIFPLCKTFDLFKKCLKKECKIS